MNTASQKRGGIHKIEAIYLPIKVKIAAPRARIPLMTFGIAKPNNVKPKNKKNNIVHQAAIVLGIAISHSPLKIHLRLREPVI